jgi:protein-tyrosine phosphatase
MRIGFVTPVTGGASASTRKQWRNSAGQREPQAGAGAAATRGARHLLGERPGLPARAVRHPRDMPRVSGNQLPPPRNASGPYRVCCVCLGNICRSPMAEVVLRARLAEAGLDGRVVVDSAGTGDWHVGDPMYRGARIQLERRGYDGSGHRARQIRPSWLAERDLILAMDAINLASLRRLAGDAADHRIRLFGEVADLHGADIPDPYGGNPAEFARVLDMLESGIRRLVDQLRTVVGTPATER